MSLNVPKDKQAFTFPIVLTSAGQILADPDSAAYVSGDIKGYFAGESTGVVLTCTQRGTTPILDVSIPTGKTGPFLVVVEDANGTAFDDAVYGPFFTVPEKRYTFDGTYLREENTSAVVQRHAVTEKVSGTTRVKEWIEGDVPP